VKSHETIGGNFKNIKVKGLGSLSEILGLETITNTLVSENLLVSCSCEEIEKLVEIRFVLIELC